MPGRHRGNRLNVAHVGHGGQGAHRGGDCAAEIRRVHGMGDVQRAEVAGDIFPDMRIAEVFIIGGRRTDLQDLRTQIAHGDPPGHRTGAVHGVFKHDVRVAGFKLDLRQALEQVAGADPAFAGPARRPPAADRGRRWRNRRKVCRTAVRRHKARTGPSAHLLSPAGR